MSQKVDYLVVGLNYHPEPTGNAPYTTDLSRALALDGSTRVITGIPHYPWWQKQVLADSMSQQGLEVLRRNHYVPKRSSFLARAFMEITFGLSVGSSKSLKAKIVILVSPAMLSSALVLLRLKLSKSPAKTVIWVQDLYEKGLRETSSKPSLLLRLVIQIERWMLKTADHVVFAHKGFASAQESLKLRRWSTVPNWSQFEHNLNAVPAIKSDQKIVLHIGNMGVKQGLENVVKAAKLAEEMDAGVCFWLLGSGNRIQYLKDLAGGCKRIRFLPLVSDEELSSYLNSAQILLVNEKPGVLEMSVPSKLTTYFQTGIPVVVCSEKNSLAAREVLENGIGYWVQSGDPRKLLEAVLSVDVGQAKEIARAGQLYAQKKLSKAVAMREFIRVLKSI